MCVWDPTAFCFCCHSRPSWSQLDPQPELSREAGAWWSGLNFERRKDKVAHLTKSRLLHPSPTPSSPLRQLQYLESLFGESPLGILRVFSLQDTQRRSGPCDVECVSQKGCWARQQEIWSPGWPWFSFVILGISLTLGKLSGLWGVVSGYRAPPVWIQL